jgi:V/A-type H+-transporting ATPase subunit D
MPDDGGRELSANRSTALELRDERRLVQEGYEFLDEKRVLLATEILRRLQRYQALEAAWLELHAQAQRALLTAAARHGFEGLTVYPRPELLEFDAGLRKRRAMGIELLEAAPVARLAPRDERAVDPSPEARRCGALHLELLLAAVRCGAEACTLRRLAAEYRRTERRARALENVLMPELDRAIAFVEEQLELHETEEAVRVHEAHRAAQRSSAS